MKGRKQDSPVKRLPYRSRKAVPVYQNPHKNAARNELIVALLAVALFFGIPAIMSATKLEGWW